MSRKSTDTEMSSIVRRDDPSPAKQWLKDTGFFKRKSKVKKPLDNRRPINVMTHVWYDGDGQWTVLNANTPEDTIAILKTHRDPMIMRWKRSLKKLFFRRHR